MQKITPTPGLSFSGPIEIEYVRWQVTSNKNFLDDPTKSSQKKWRIVTFTATFLHRSCEQKWYRGILRGKALDIVYQTDANPIMICASGFNSGRLTACASVAYEGANYLTFLTFKRKTGKHIAPLCGFFVVEGCGGRMPPSFSLDSNRHMILDNTAGKLCKNFQYLVENQPMYDGVDNTL